MTAQDNLSAVDLRGLSEAQIEALRLEALRRGLSFSRLMGELVGEIAERMLKAA